MADLKALIEKARAAQEAAQGVAEDIPTVPVEVADVLVDVGLRRVPGMLWADLIATHPARPGSDEGLGFNTDGAVSDYPVEYVTIDGEQVDESTWRDMFAVLSSPSIKRLAALAWGINQLAPQQKIADLGKARAGVSTKKRRSRGNSASPSDV